MRMYSCEARAGASPIPLPHYSQRHPQRTLPHHVGNKLKVLAIPGIEKRARAFELLQFQHVLIGAGEIDGLRPAVGPLHAQHVRLEMATESEMRHRLRGDTGLVELAGTHLEPGADAVRVVLAAPETQRREPDAHREVRVPTVVAEHMDAALAPEDEILIAAAVDVGDDQRSDGIAPYFRRQELAAVREPAGPIVVGERGAVRPGDVQVEPTV